MARHMVALLATFLLVVAGCATPGGPSDATPTPHQNAAGQEVVAHRQGGLVEVPAAWHDVHIVEQRTGLTTVEPTLGVLSDGAIVAPAWHVRLAAPTGQALSEIGPWLSDDDGATWTLLPSSILADEHASFDPWIWVDQETDRIFHVGTNLACVYVAWSDDRGQTWQENPLGCGVAASTYSDHESLVTGPPPEGETNPYPSLVYVARNGGPGITVQSPGGGVLDSPVFGSYSAVSRDGGLTFEPAVRAHLQDECQVGIQGPITVGPDGTAYYPKATCRGLDIAVSQNGGRSWSIEARLNDRGASHALQNPHVAVDAASNPYSAFQGIDGLLWMHRTSEGNWTPGVRVSPPGITATFFSHVVAGAEGQVAFLYHGTTADTSTWRHPEAPWAEDDAVWHTYMTFSTDARAADPLFVTVRVSDDPVLIGCTTAVADPCDNRAHYDFAGLVEREGVIYGSIMDACDRCSTAEESTASDLVILRAEGGPAFRP